MPTATLVTYVCTGAEVGTATTGINLVSVLVFNREGESRLLNVVVIRVLQNYCIFEKEDGVYTVDQIVVRNRLPL